MPTTSAPGGDLPTRDLAPQRRQRILDIVSARLSERSRAWIDLFGGIFMLLPAAAIICWFGWSAFLESYRISETSPDAGGLLRWPIKLVVPLAFALRESKSSYRTSSLLSLRG